MTVATVQNMRGRMARRLGWVLIPAALALSTACTLPAWAADSAAPAKLPSHVTVANADLVLNGIGTRSIFGTKVYQIGLYLPQKATSAADAIGEEGPKRLEIVMLHDATAQQVTDGLIKSLTRNNSAQDLARLKDGIEQFRQQLLELQNVPSGTAFTIDFSAQGGTRLLVNREPRGKAIAGADFSKAVLRIWLGERPTQQSVKDGLLQGDSGAASS